MAKQNIFYLFSHLFHSESDKNNFDALFNRPGVAGAVLKTTLGFIN